MTVSGSNPNQSQPVPPVPPAPPAPPGPPAPPNPADWDTGDTGNFYTEQIASIQRLRRWATVVAVVALASLIAALGMTVWSFTKQIDKATPDVDLKALVAGAKAGTSTANPAQGSPKVPPAVDTKDANLATVTKALSAEPLVVKTAVSVDISSIGNSVVAVVSVLVVAIAVLAISLLRTTYTLSVERLRDRTAVRPVEVDTSLPIPGAELVKAIGEALATVLKGLPGKRDS